MKTKIYSALFAACSIFFASCSGLNLEPGTAIDPETLGETEVQQLLTGTYRVLQSNPTRDTWVLFDMRGENLMGTYLSGANPFSENDIRENNGSVLSMWRGYYKAINEANITLATLAKCDASATNSNIEAQTRFLRAYAYYCLATRWDGVPLITENTLELVKRDSQEKVFQFVKQELEFCINNLKSAKETSNAPFIASKEAAQSILARLSLAMGDKTAAASLAEAVIKSENYSLSDDYDGIFSSSNNSELVFAFKNSTTEGAVNLYALFTTYNSPMKGSWFLCPTPEAERMFDDVNDTRKATNVNVLVTSAGDEYKLMNKFRDFSPLIVTRIAEMYLISAEAQGLSGITRLNELRVKRGLSPLAITSEAEYQEAVALERRKELFSEGFLFFDLIRTGKVFDEVSNIKSEADFYLPLPEAEVTANPNLVQYN